MGKVVLFPVDRPVRVPDLPHAAEMRCVECGSRAQLALRRADAFDQKFEIWTYACDNCSHEMTTRVER